MRRLLTTMLLLAASAAAYPQVRILDPADYDYPVRNVAGLCSANFGEMRPDHFHSGVDIKTDGAEGKPVTAIADGFVSRITVTPSGYGRALYISHRDGTLSVYGHLSAFRADIDSLVQARRYGRRKNSVDIVCDSTAFPVRRGDEIALSGNTGNSFGPHLHFEIRDAASNTTLNLIRQGVIRVADSRPPLINALWYIAVDSLGTLPVRAAPRRIEVRRTAEGRYTVDKSVAVAPCGYFIIETTDRKDNVHNRFGVWRVTERVDGQTLFEYRNDGYRMEDTRWCNAVAYYPMQVAARSEMIVLAKHGAAPDYLYTAAVGNGLLRIQHGDKRRITVETEDDCANVSVLTFEVEVSLDPPTLPETADSLIIDCTKPYTAAVGDITVSLPAGALPESAIFTCRRSERQGETTPLTPLYDVMDCDIPLLKAARISLRAYIPEELRPHAAMALLNAKGKFVYAGGEWRNGCVETRTTKFGTFAAVVDTVAPHIVPRFAKDADMRKGRSLSFTVSDDFAGIKEFSARIDGEWVPLEYLPIKGRLVHRFDDRSRGGNARHVIVLTVTDNCGNTATVRETFIR